MIPSPKFKENREAPRYSLARLATILPGNGAPPRYCLVTDISDGGVRIDLNGYIRLPDEFVLLFAGDAPAQNGTYKVIWRRGQEVGAKFIKKASEVRRA